MDKRDFIEKFRADIRVRVDWDMFLSGDDWHVRIEHLRLSDAAQRLWTPWYPNAAKGPPPTDPQAWPFSVSAAAANRHRLGSNQESLDKHMAAWHADAVIEAPAFALPRERYLLLDRNHHVIAGLLLGRDAPLMLAVIDGPAGAKLLPDLPRFD